MHYLKFVFSYFSNILFWFTQVVRHLWSLFHYSVLYHNLDVSYPHIITYSCSNFEDICAMEQCLHGGTCQISENSHRCECVDGYLGGKCQYAGKEVHVFIFFHSEIEIVRFFIFATSITKMEYFRHFQPYFADKF